MAAHDFCRLWICQSSSQLLQKIHNSLHSTHWGQFCNEICQIKHFDFLDQNQSAKLLHPTLNNTENTVFLQEKSCLLGVLALKRKSHNIVLLWLLDWWWQFVRVCFSFLFLYLSFVFTSQWHFFARTNTLLIVFGLLCLPHFFWEECLSICWA